MMIDTIINRADGAANGAAAWTACSKARGQPYNDGETTVQ